LDDLYQETLLLSSPLSFDFRSLKTAAGAFAASF
jgi:hypothetical protein